MQIDNIIVKMKFGSHLYGTDTPESDLDLKGVFLPDVGSLLLGKRVNSINKSTGSGVVKNTSDDIDEEFYSLHYFLKMALEGQTVAMDMLHAPQSAIIRSSHLWDILVEHRSRFYTKKLTAFVGYARRQAAKYGVKGSRLADVRMVVNFLEKWIKPDHNPVRLRHVWSQLPTGEHIEFTHEKHRSEKAGGNPLRVYQICGKSFQETARLDYVHPILENFLLEYGERARKAEKNEGVDWKAMSHALRAAYQVRELLTSHTITMPRPEARLLLRVKQGLVDFKAVQKALESAMSEIEELASTSTLPDKADHRFADDFIHYAYGYIGDGYVSVGA